MVNDHLALVMLEVQCQQLGEINQFVSSKKNQSLVKKRMELVKKNLSVQNMSRFSNQPGQDYYGGIPVRIGSIQVSVTLQTQV